MWKFLFLLVIIVAIFLFVSNNLTNKKLELIERENKLNILNLSSSSRSKFRNSNSLNQTKQALSKQMTCCNNHYELSDKYSFAKLNQICNLIPIEIACMKKCLKIDKDKRIEFNLEVSDKIDEWIEHRLSFEEAICLKIKNQITEHTKRLLSKAIPIELARSENRLSREKVFQLIKYISANLGLNEMNGFENQILFSDRKSNEYIINKRGIEILKQIRILGKLLFDENQDRISNAKSRSFTPEFTHNHEINHFSELNQPKNNLHSIYFDQPSLQFQNSVDKYQFKQYKNLYNEQPSNFNRKSINEDTNQNGLENKSSENNEFFDELVENYQCVQINLNQSFANHLLNAYPNLTIFNLESLNKRSNDIENFQSQKQMQNRGIFSFLNFKEKDKQKMSNRPDQINSKQEFDTLPSKLISQFSSSVTHDYITNLANEMIQNNSFHCQQEFLPNISELLTLNLKLKHLSNNYERNNSEEINTICSQILKIGSKLSIISGYCKQSVDMKLMIRHTFNETESSFDYCVDFASNHKMNISENEMSESSPIADHDHQQLNSLNLNQTKELNKIFNSSVNKNSLQGNTFDCFNWNNLKLCQNRFIPWFELIENEELERLIDNKSIKFNELNLFKRNVSIKDNVSQTSIAEINCKDIMLFENCVKEDLEDLFSIDLNSEDDRSMKSENSTCKFGYHRLNRVALINNLANKIINEINQQVLYVCPKLDKILNLDKSIDEEEAISFRTNIANHFSREYMDAIDDKECLTNSKLFVDFCVQTYNDQLKPSYVQFFKNFELQNYFGKFFVSNDLILPRICCAQRQLARCFISAANFKCSRNRERTIELLKIGDLAYCNEMNSKFSMSKCRSILSIGMSKSSSSCRLSFYIIPIAPIYLLILQLTFSFF